MPRRSPDPATEDDLQTQVNCCEAFFQTFWKKDWVLGAYFWKWFPKSRQGRVYGKGFSPQNKPAEQVMSKWYAKNKNQLFLLFKFTIIGFFQFCLFTLWSAVPTQTQSAVKIELSLATLENRKSHGRLGVCCTNTLGKARTEQTIEEQTRTCIKACTTQFSSFAQATLLIMQIEQTQYQLSSQVIRLQLSVPFC